MATLRYTIKALVPVKGALPETKWITLHQTPWGVPASKQVLDDVGSVADALRAYYVRVVVWEERYRQPSASKTISR